MRPVFERIRAALSEGTKSYIVDASGPYLVNLREGRIVPTSQTRRWQDDFPELANSLGDKPGTAAVLTAPDGQRVAAVIGLTTFPGGLRAGVIETASLERIMAPATALQSSVPDRGAVRRGRRGSAVGVAGALAGQAGGADHRRGRWLRRERPARGAGRASAARPGFWPVRSNAWWRKSPRPRRRCAANRKILEQDHRQHGRRGAGDRRRGAAGVRQSDQPSRCSATSPISAPRAGNGNISASEPDGVTPMPETECPARRACAGESFDNVEIGDRRGTVSR